MFYKSLPEEDYLEMVMSSSKEAFDFWTTHVVGYVTIKVEEEDKSKFVSFNGNYYAALYLPYRDSPMVMLTTFYYSAECVHFLETVIALAKDDIPVSLNGNGLLVTPWDKEDFMNRLKNDP